MENAPSVRLAYLVSHPIQYQAPLLRRIAREPGIDLTVLFGSDFSVRSYRDEGFGRDVAWDTPLLDGYRSAFLPSVRDTGALSLASPISRGIYSALRRLQPDALWVHGYASINALHGILAANALGIPVLLRAESWLADRPRSPLTLALKNLFFAALGHAVDAVLPIGTVNAAYWTHYLPHTPQFLMPYAVDNDYFASRADAARPHTADLRTSLGLAPDRPVILFASKLQPRKHADHLLHAFQAFLTSNPGAPFPSLGAPFIARSWRDEWETTTPRAASNLPQLLFVGDGESRPALESLTAALGLTDHVRFAGFRNQSELPGLFALADVFVLPSRHEPWGLIVNEAMASGCPVIVSSDVGCHPDLVPTNSQGGPFMRGSIAHEWGTTDVSRTTAQGGPFIARSLRDAWGTIDPTPADAPAGLVYPVGDIPALTAALRRIFAAPETAQQMGLAARRRIATWGFDQDIAGLRSALAHTTAKLRL
jgi:glycosyltransferase involved in cell wall biosynthesis